MSKGYLGEEIKKLGFGFMRLPMLGEEFDFEQLNKMVDTYMEKGFSYFDTAYVYHGQKSEIALRKSVVERYPRESFQLATKMPLWVCQTPEDLYKVYEESLERAGVDYYDFYLLHAMNKERFEEADRLNAWEFMQEMKAAGKVKHAGFSFHDSAEVLDEVLAKHSHEVEFIQLQINYADWESENVQSRACYEVALKYNMPVIIMEPVKGGSLAKLPLAAQEEFKAVNPDLSVPSWAVRYAASLENIVTVLSGMSTEEQLNDNTSYMEDFKKLTEEEYKTIDKVVDILESMPTIPCTDCKYCVEGCPMKINIPRLFSISNENKMFGVEGEAPVNANQYANVTNESGKASACIKCGKCEGQCPQHIHIIDELKGIAALYEA